MGGGGLLFSPTFEGVLVMEPEEAGLMVLLFNGFLLAVINGDLAVVLDNILSELSLIEDLVDSTLLAVEDPKEEDLDDGAGFGNTLLAPLKTGTFAA